MSQSTGIDMRRKVMVDEFVDRALRGGSCCEGGHR